MMRTPVDAAVREQCLNPRQSFSVRAPAGSGKTELLTQRVLVLLSLVQKPEDILCITFTRKAAAEMLDRLLENLRWAATTAEPEPGYKQKTWQLAQAALQQDAQQGWQLLSSPNRLRIQTIDGLCARLTQSLPLQSGFGSQPEIFNQPYPLYQQAVSRLLEQLDNEDAVADALAKLLSHLDNQVERLQELLISMLARRDQWLPLLGRGGDVTAAQTTLEDALNRLLQEELQQLQAQLQLFEPDLVQAIDYAASNLAADTKQLALSNLAGITCLPDTAPQSLPQWQGIKALLLTNDNSWRRSLTVREGFPPGKSKEEKATAKARKDHLLALIEELKLQPGILDRLARLPLLPNGHYQPSQWRLLQSLTIVLPNLVAHLLLSFNDHAAVDYTQITQGALESLGDEDSPTDLSLMLDYQIQHILVDEFQDTSSPQIRLLERLTRGWEQGDGRSLFIVGDGMQSCYGFRDANVGLFLDARKHGIGSVTMQAADLSVNFRSQKPIVDWVNNAFDPAFPPVDDIGRGAVSYEHSDAFNQSADNACISIDAYVGFDDRSAEAQRVCQLAQQSLTDYPEQRVAILVRNRTHLREILPALRSAGLKWQATDLDTLASRMWVVDLVSLLKAWLNPADRIAWLAILRAPWCGLSNADLLAIAGKARKTLPVWQSLQDLPDTLSTDGHQRLTAMTNLLSKAKQQRCRMPLRDEIEALWIGLKGPELLQSQSQYDDIQRVLELIDSHEQSGFIPSMSLFERDLQQLYAAPDSDADARLQVMTIHKSKGLEFETVILAGLDRQARNEEKQLLLWQQRVNETGDEDLLLSPIAATGDDEDSLYQYLRHEQKLKDRMEGTRLLYVGATRAISRLHIVCQLGIDSKGNAKAPASSSLLASIWAHITDQANIVPAPDNSEIPHETTTGSAIQRITANALAYSTPLTNPTATSAGEQTSLELAVAEAADNDGNRPEPDWQQSQRLVGTLIHRILQQWVEMPDAFQSRDWPDFYPLWQQQLQQLGLNPATAQAQLTLIAEQLSNISNDSQGQWLLNPQHQDSACELALSMRLADSSVNLIIDRTFIDEQGTRWIVDYKTAAPSPEQSIDDFIAAEAIHYRPQLERYRQAFQQWQPGCPVRCALYFTALPRWLEID